jgi:hypothetical protein
MQHQKLLSVYGASTSGAAAVSHFLYLLLWCVAYLYSGAMQAPGTRYVEAHFVPKAFFRVSVSFLQSFIITHAPSSYIFLCAFWTIIICTAQLYYTRRFKKRNVFCWETYKFERPITHRADSLRIWLMWVWPWLFCWLLRCTYLF